MQRGLEIIRGDSGRRQGSRTLRKSLLDQLEDELEAAEVQALFASCGLQEATQRT